MNQKRIKENELNQIEQRAAEWVLRRDRALIASEQDEFCQWLAADRRHGACFARHARNWGRLDQMTEWRPPNSLRPNPDLLAVPERRIRWALPVSLAAAAAVAFALFSWWRHLPRSDTLPLPTKIEERVLTDGSRILLNHGAAVQVEYLSTERRVHLERGEAQFDVAKNPNRPFIVDAGGVCVRAVGTAFDVRLEERAVSVLVTEGSVRVDRAEPNRSARETEIKLVRAVPILAAGQQARISVGSGNSPAEVIAISPENIRSLLAWEPQLLDFTASPLSDIVAEFNRHNLIQLTVVGADLANLRISATFRSDNVDGFVSLLQSSFGVQIERLGQNRIVLQRSR